MISRFRRVNGKISFVVAIVLMFNMLLPQLGVFAQLNEATLAKWDFTAKPEDNPISAISGELKEDAKLSYTATGTPGYGTGSFNMTGWDNGANAKYWQVELSTEGYENINLQASARSSNTGPKEFKVQYSSDASTWEDISGSNYTLTTTLTKIFSEAISMPKEVSDLSKVYIRFVMTSNVSVNGATVGTGGVSNINSIIINGTAKVSDSSVNQVIATPNSGEIKLGSQIELSTGTEGATIYYKLNNGEELIYNKDSKIKVESLPITIVVYAKKQGLKNSVSSTYNYTQARVQNVSATPNGGAVVKGKKISLNTKTDGATIKYSLNDGDTYQIYTEEIELNIFPSTIKAYAECEGMIQSAISEFKFIERQNSEYGIYFGQLHGHTNTSDGIGTPDDAYKYAKSNANLDFFSLTDHSNWFDNALNSNMGDASLSEEWKLGLNKSIEYTDDTFVGLHGFEMTWSNGKGHINTFNTPGMESRDDAKYKTSDGLKVYYDILKQYPSSIAQYNHPGATFGDFDDFGYYDEEIDAIINLIEVGNGEGKVGSSGYFRSYDYYTRALDKGWHLSPTNNQDNHKGKWGNANTARTVALADGLTLDSIYDAFRNRRTYATEDENLRIRYFLNDEVMGSIINDKPNNVNIKVEIEDPDKEAIGKVSVVVNGGKIIESKDINSSKEIVEFNLPADYSYYYIRIEQEDSDIAVTAPVWVGDVEKIGVSKSETNTKMPIKGQEFSITSSLFNNENIEFKVSKIEYSIDGQVINNFVEGFTVRALSTYSYSFNYIPIKAGKYNVDIKIVGTLNGVEKVFTDVLKIEVVDESMISKIVVDATHNNDYVSGYYADSMGNFVQVANENKFSVNIEKNKIADELLNDAQLLIITAPAKKAGTASGISYTPQSFSDEFIQTVKRYVDNGGTVIVSGIASYQDGVGEYSSSTQVNKLLEAIGATTRLNKDQMIDNDNNLGQAYRLGLTNYNKDSEFLQGLTDEQIYSFYSGCTVNIDKDAQTKGTVKALIKGHETTFSNDPKQAGTPEVVGKGEAVALAVEHMNSGGKVFISGTVFMSNYEVKVEMENAGTAPYINYTLVENILNNVRKETVITPIKEVLEANQGDMFTIEGTVTSGTITGNAFFDCIYLQDNTAGINLFPVSGVEIRPGQKLRVVGSVSSYEGERQLNVESFYIIDDAINEIEPKEMTIKDAIDPNNVGYLVKVTGTIKSARIENKVVQSIIVKDEDNKEARVFMNGYIGYSDTNSQNLEDLISEGATITAIGLASVDPEGSRIRVRDRSEISITKSEDKEITIIHTNDMHGRAKTDNSVIGLDVVAAIKEQFKNSLLLDAGDSIHGIPFATINKGLDIIELMKLAKYDVMTPGNHDFNYGYERLLELSKIASSGENSFDIVSANVLKAISTLANSNTLLKANTIKEVDGVKVGIFGLTTQETTYKTNPNNVLGLEFKDEIEVAKEQVNTLKEAGANIIIALAHVGDDKSTQIRSIDIANEVEGIDLIVDGHSHSKYENGLKVKDTLIVSTGEYLSNIGKVTIIVDSNNKVKGIDAELINKQQSLVYEPNEAVKAKLDEISASQNLVLSKVVGTTSNDLDGERVNVRAGETNLGNLITDAMINASGAQIAITNGGGIRASIKQGNITKGDIITVLPFGNFIVTKYLTGAQIKDVIEHGIKDAPNLAGHFPHVAGISFVYNPENIAGERIVKIMFNNEELDMDKLYLVATNDFISAGGDGYPHFSNINTENNFEALDEALEGYIAKIGVINYSKQNRILTLNQANEIAPNEEETNQDVDDKPGNVDNEQANEAGETENVDSEQDDKTDEDGIVDGEQNNEVDNTDIEQETEKEDATSDIVNKETDSSNDTENSEGHNIENEDLPKTGGNSVDIFVLFGLIVISIGLKLISIKKEEKN